MIREATIDDGPRLQEIFLSMLKEIEPMGHDVAATELNAYHFWNHVFKPAIECGRHGIFIMGDAAVFIVPEQTGDFESPDRRAMDWGCYVPKDFRRKGVGTELRNRAKDRMKSIGVRRIVSNVLVQNISGIESYRKVGAKITGYQMEIELT